MKKHSLLALSCLVFFVGKADVVKDSLLSIHLINFNYSYQIPKGDIAKKFGNNSSLGLGYTYKTNQNFAWSLEANFLFGDNVRTNNLFDNITTSQGYLLTADGTYANVQLFERGYSAFLQSGKIINVLANNPNSGLFFQGGIGFLQHKIKIQNLENNIPQLQGEYIKGYDQLTNGIAFSQFVGYRYFDNKGFINFFAGVELIEALTKNRRAYNYALMQHDTTLKSDMLIGFKFGWSISIYNQSHEDDFFYY